MYIRILSILFCLIVLSFYSCSDDPSSLGSAILSDDLINILELNSETDSIAQSSSYFKQVTQLGSTNRILLGKSGNIESASILMKFLFVLNDSIKQAILNDSLNVISSKVKLTKNYSFGDSNAVIDYTVHQINNSWTSLGFTSDSLPNLLYDQADVSSNRIFTDTLYTFDIDNNLVSTWLKAEADTAIPQDNGVFIKPTDNSGKVVGFQALVFTEGAPVPILEVIVEKPGSYLDTLLFAPTADVGVVNGTIPQVNPENIVIQSSLSLKSKLWFDISSIPVNAILNNAELSLAIDTIETHVGNSYSNSLAAFFLEDSATTDIDSEAVLTLSNAGNIFKGNITTYVQKWLNGESNQGLLLTALQNGEGVELFVLKGSTSISTLRPKLNIIYTNKK